MAIYHCSVKIVSRNAGRSAVAAAAYRSGECLINEYDGVEHDYTKKNWIEHSEICLPRNAPKAYIDRSTLWNAVELVEKTQDAQLAREFELAIPVELTSEQRIELVRRFAEKNLVSQGMVVDIAIHNPPVTNDRHQPIDESGRPTKDVNKMIFKNPHGHLLATVRPIDDEGCWEKKSEVEYICKRDGEEKAFTSSEYNMVKGEGWEKQYKYYYGKKKIFCTPSEAAVNGLKRVDRVPRTTPYGRKNPKTEFWNSKDRIFEWRQQWAHEVNLMLRDIGSNARVDCRSYVEQGVEEIPTIHKGTAATNIERRRMRKMSEGIVTYNTSDIEDINREIREHNRIIKEFRDKLEELTNKAKNYVDGVARKLEGIRARIISNYYVEQVLKSRIVKLGNSIKRKENEFINFEEQVKKAYESEKEATKTIRKLQKELAECSMIQIKRKSEIRDKIKEIQEKSEIRDEYIQGVRQKTGYITDDDYKEAKIAHNKMKKSYKKVEDRINIISDDTEKNLKEYHSIVNTIPHNEKQAISNLASDIQLDFQDKVKNSLYLIYKERFDEELFQKAVNRADKVLKNEDESNNKKLSISNNYIRKDRITRRR